MLIVLRRLFGVLAIAPFVLWVLALAVTLGLTQLAGCNGVGASDAACRLAGFDLTGMAAGGGMVVTWGLLFVLPAFFFSGILWFVMGWLRNNHW